jgi:hypothetical protein
MSMTKAPSTARPVGDGEARGGDDQAAERRPDHLGRLEHGLVQRGRRRELLPAHQPGQRRRPGRRVDAGHAGGRRGEHEDGPQARGLERRVQRQTGAGRRHQHLGQQEQLAPVHRVGDGAAPQRPDDERAELHEAHQAHREGRPGLLVHLDGHGGDRDLPADDRDDLSDPEQPEVA